MWGKRQKGNGRVLETSYERTSCMKRYILTGTPGSGKTSILHELKRQGYWVVDEAATDVIAREQGLGNSEPWLQADFLEGIIRWQRQRQFERLRSLIY